MRDYKLDPAYSVILAFGGASAVAQITGRSVSRVYRWTYPKSAGGTGGFIPQAEAETLLAHARANKLPVTADSFFRSEAA